MRTLEQLKRRAIMDALDECGGNKTKAAKALGMSRASLYEYIKRKPINRPLEQSAALSVKHRGRGTGK